MGITKSDIFSSKANELATIFKCLGHPARVAILQFIIDQKACIGNDLVEAFDLAQPTISQHLKELKSAGLIKGTIEGKSVCYCINEQKWRSVERFISSFVNQDVLPKQSGCC